jgi:hypothetical protein
MTNKSNCQDEFGHNTEKCVGNCHAKDEDCISCEFAEGEGMKGCNKHFPLWGDTWQRLYNHLEYESSKAETVRDREKNRIASDICQDLKAQLTSDIEHKY